MYCYILPALSDDAKVIVNEIVSSCGQSCDFYLGRDIQDFKLVCELVSKVDLVYHLAALPSHRRALEDPLGYAYDDLIGTINILEAVRLSTNKPKVVFTSTNKVYGKVDPPFREDQIVSPQGPYGMAKYQAEQWCELYHQYFGINVVVARLFHVIGARTQPDREISIFTESIINDQPIFVHGKYDDNKNFISCSAGYTNVFDTVEGLILLAEKAKSYDVYNIGSTEETKVEDIARMVYKYFNKLPNITFKEMLPHESLRHGANNFKIRNLGWEQKFSMGDSVQQYINWRIKVGPRKAEYH